jgi:UDP-3-O-[3-hydroxymyristoyl] glucosamine N-acyltransferase
MRILLTNITLAGRTGTVIVTRDLALGLAALGHDPVVFSPNHGPVADEIKRAGVAVVNSLDDVTEAPDVIHGHHLVETTLATLRFPSTPAIFVCHDRLIWHDSAPQLPQIRRYVVVDRNGMERLTYECGIPADKIRVIPNAVDLSRFRRRTVLPPKPQRALVFSDHTHAGTHVEPILQACSILNIKVDAVGAGLGASSDALEAVLPEYDLVFAMARCALEALAVGNAVILSGTRGLGGLVRTSDVAALRDWNFGMRCLQQRLSLGLILSEIQGYDSGDAAAVSSWIRQTAALDDALAAYVRLYEEAIAEAQSVPILASVGEALATLARRSGELEKRIRSSGVFLMLPLPAPAVRQISVRSIEQLRTTTLGAESEILVEIENGSTETLASLEPHPINLAYHWLDPVSGQPVVFDGHRTALTGNIPPFCKHRQKQRIVSPPQPGHFVLRLAIVQELIGWFENENPGAGADIVVDVRSADTSNHIGLATRSKEFYLQQASQWTSGLTVVRDAAFSRLGFAPTVHEGMLTFVESSRYADEMIRSQSTCSVLTTAALAPRFPEGFGVAVSDHPRKSFTDVHNHLATRTAFYWDDFPTCVDPSAHIDAGAQVPEFNVVIGAGVVIEKNVTIGERVILGERCVVQSGAVLGAEGFQTSRYGSRLQEMAHAGGVRIDADAKIFSNAVIARGLFREFTHVGREARVGNMAFISHNVRVGARAFVGHGAIVNGNVEIGDDAWIGPNASVANSISIGSGAYVSIGATVIRSVKTQRRVLGSVAVESRKMIRFTKRLDNGKL